MRIRSQQRYIPPTPVIKTVDKAAIPKRRKPSTKANNHNAAVTNRFERRPCL